MQQFRRDRCAEILKVSRDIVDNRKQRRVNCMQLSLTCGDDVVNRLKGVSTCVLPSIYELTCIRKSPYVPLNDWIRMVCGNVS